MKPRSGACHGASPVLMCSAKIESVVDVEQGLRFEEATVFMKEQQEQLLSDLTGISFDEWHGSLFHGQS